MNFIITALAVYGLAALISSYDGAWSIFARLRNKYPNSPLQCAVCTSVWLVLPIMALSYFGGVIFVVPFAIIGVVILLEKIR